MILILPMVPLLLSNPTKQIDSNWSEGNNAGGFPSGLTLAADTHYYVFLIGKNDGTIDSGFDTAINASNLLADATDYDWYRQVNSVFTDGSSNILGFTDYGNGRIIYNAEIIDVNDASGTPSTWETGTLSAEPNSLAITRSSGEMDITDDVAILLRDLTTSGAPSGTGYLSNTGSATRRVSGQIEIVIDANRTYFRNVVILPLH